MTTTARVDYEAVFTRGDLNTDLAITTTDIAAVYNIIAGKQPEQTDANLIYTDPDTGTKYYHTIKSGYLAWIADLNGDSAITTTDIATIYNLIAGGTLSAAELARQNPALPNDIAYQTTDENTSKNLLIVFPRKLKIFDDTHFSGSTFYNELKKNFKIYSDSDETTEVLNVIDSVSITNNTTGTLTIKLTTLPDVATDYYVKYLSKVDTTGGSHQIAYDSLAYQSFSKDTAYGGSIYEGMLIPDFITRKFSIPKKTDFAAANTPATGDLVLEGTLTVGQELTVKTDNLTDPVNGLTNPVYTYEWSRVDDTTDPETITPISSATSNKYTLVADDVAKKIYVTVTFNDNAGNSETKTTHTQTTISDVTQQDQGPSNIALSANQFDENIDVNTTVATISADGNNLTFELVDDNDSGKFTISGTSLNINESPDFETKPSYTIKIKATDDKGDTADNIFILNVSNKNDPLTGDLIITGTQQKGQQLSVSEASLNDQDGIKSRTYQWYRVVESTDTEITGETNNNYTLTADDVDKQVKVVVTITDNLDNTQLKDATTGTITQPANIQASGGALLGVQGVGSTLTVDINSILDNNGLVGVTYNYEWKRDDSTIAGAVNQTYTLVSEDETAIISVVVTFNDNSDYAETITLNTGIIKAANSAATLIEGSSLISGIEKVGEVLSTNIAAILDNNGIGSMEYKWERDGYTISTSDDYTLVDDDLNKVIKLTVTFLDNDGYSETLTEETGNIKSNINNPATGEIQLTENNFDNILIRKLKQFTFSNNDFTVGSSVIPKWSAMNTDLIKTAIGDVDGLASDYTINWNINHGGNNVALTDNSSFDIDTISVDNLTLSARFQDSLVNDELLTKAYTLEDVITIKTNLQNSGLSDPTIYLAENQNYELTFETEIPDIITNTSKNLNTFYDWEFEFTNDQSPASPTWVGGFYKLLNNDQVNLTDWDNINSKYNSITTDDNIDGIKLVVNLTDAKSEDFLLVRAKSKVLWTPPSNRDGVDSNNDDTIINYPWQDNTNRSFPSGIDNREWRGGEVISETITFKRVISVPENKIVSFEFAGENIVSFRLNDFIFSADQIVSINNESTTKYTDLFTLKRGSSNIAVNKIQVDNITVGAVESARIKLTIDNSNIAYNSNDVYSVSLNQTYGSYIFCNSIDVNNTKSYNISFSTFKNIDSTNLEFYSNSIKLGLDATVNSLISLDGSIIGDNRITSSNDLVGILWKNQNDEGQNRYILYKDRYEEYTSTDTDTPTSTTNFGDYTLDDYIRFRVENNDLKVILSPVFGESNPFKDCYIKYLSFYNNTQNFIKLTTGDQKDRCLITKINSARTERPKPSNNVYQISTVIGLSQDRSDMASAINTYAFKIENNLVIAGLAS